ncbi:MAG TPA: hypothetical protein DEF34_08635 [Desulfotomaculum sp.]|nr:MAG: hypothetical protein VR67_16575 [Peptococcaceae bacterium BRH_c8a]KJS76609.1 MAG: hypothetical protein JL56_04880 [Desulfotomaculum sp. BICA1-6]HBX23675.1 hypothetical protein [Desulfotomaculum sp.]
MNTRWLIFNQKNILIAAVILVLLFVALRATESFRTRAVQNPEELFHAALVNTLSSQSFCFSVQVKMSDREISAIEGKKAAPDGVHIVGTMQNTPVEFIHVEGQAYIKGYWSDNWSVLPENSLVNSELFITELNPLGSFVFRDIPEIRYLNSEKVNGEKLDVLELRPIVENPLMEMNYDDFVYHVWVEPKNQVIKKAHITAAGKNGSRDRLDIVIELWDYNKQIKILPPDYL